VRIFVGTEALQYRPERVLVWSIERVRDPSRTYEIHLMKDLVGFDRARWLTGFTNYRFAIPHLAGRVGRAIYNDVDQIYLRDPAELFDTDMAAHGFLALSPQDTAVMLIDCARMAAVWPLETVRRERRKAIEARAHGLWGRLEPAWHCRDWEFDPERTNVLHYTTIHWQPWQPLPQHFVYHSTPAGETWHALERAADEAGFEIFTAGAPSAAYTELVAGAHRRRGSANGAGRADAAGFYVFGGLSDAAAARDEVVHEALRAVAARSVLEHTFLPAARVVESAFVETDRRDGRADGGGPPVERWDPTWPTIAAAPAGRFDAVVSTSGLEALPDDDVPWTIDALIARARALVVLVIRDGIRVERAAGGATIDVPGRGESWWAMHIAAASLRHPDVHCRVVFDAERANGSPAALRVREWGRRLGGPPRVWILGDDKAGHTTQSVGLATALGWPYEIKTIKFNALNRVSNHLLDASLVSVARRRSSALAPPWPDVVISTGRRTAPVARWIGAKSGGHARLVQLGRKGGEVVDDFDAVITCAHFRLPLHAHRIETVVPLNAVNPVVLAAAAQRWVGHLGAAPRPHVALLVGGNSALHQLDAVTARRMGADVRRFAEGAGGSVFAITSPRTGPAATAALRAALDGPHRVHEWRRDDPENPYLGYLALADVLVVTGESESMLAEAAAAAKPLYIYPLPCRPLRLRDRLRGWVVARAHAQPRKRKGTIRPQQGLEYLCARLIERGLVHPLRDLDQLHAALVRRDVARYFGAPLETGGPWGLREIDAVARRVRALVGVTNPPARDDDRGANASGITQASAS
jgi:hypothetical protein